MRNASLQPAGVAHSAHSGCRVGTAGEPKGHPTPQRLAAAGTSKLQARHCPATSARTPLPHARARRRGVPSAAGRCVRAAGRGATYRPWCGARSCPARSTRGSRPRRARPPLTQHHPQHVGLHHTHDVLRVLAGQGAHSVRIGPRVAAGWGAGDELSGGRAGRQAARVTFLAQQQRRQQAPRQGRSRARAGGGQPRRKSANGALNKSRCSPPRALHQAVWEPSSTHLIHRSTVPSWSLAKSARPATSAWRATFAPMPCTAGGAPPPARRCWAANERSSSTAEETASPAGGSQGREGRGTTIGAGAASFGPHSRQRC